MSHGDPFVLVGDLRTQDPARPRAEAMAVREGRILAVGSRADVVAALPPGASVRTAPGTVVPGLIDAHVHTMIGGIEMRRLDVSDAASVAEAVDRIGAHLKAESGSEWLVIAAHFQAEELAEGRLPTRQDLDPVTGGRPVYLDRRTHDAIVNSAALERAGIDRDTPDPQGGRIEHDSDGALTGILIERPAADLVFSLVPELAEADRRTALRGIQPQLHRLGVTGAAEPGLTPAELGTYQAAWADGELTVRTLAMPLADTDVPPEELLPQLRGVGARTGFGDEWLRLGAFKVYLDGTGSYGTALMREPWPGTDGYFGNQTAPTETFAAIAELCARERWSLAVHTVGGGAIDLALDVFAAADAVAPIAPLRFSLIHAYLWPSPQNMKRARKLGVMTAIQPGMQWRVAASLAVRFGAERAAAASPLRDWLEAGVEVAGGSDGPDFPLPPLFGMYQARSRAAQGFEEPLGPEQAIDGERALAMYTTSAARYCFGENERGALRPGLLADWAAVSVDPVECEAAELAEAEVLQTAVGGGVVHET